MTTRSTHERDTPPREEWTARQCADHHGVTRNAWYHRVYHNTAPQPVRKTGHTLLWDAEQVRAAFEPPQQEGEWTAKQCAEHHSIPLKTWRSYVDTGRGPQPARRTQYASLWDEKEVRATRVGPPQQEGEWTAKQCAEHHGITVNGWRLRVTNETAPQPTRKAGRNLLWDADEVRNFAPGATRRTPR